MGNKGAKPDNAPETNSSKKAAAPQVTEDGLPRGRSFRCQIRGTEEDRILCVSFPNLYLFGADKVLMATFPIKYLRGYGQMQNVFSFETGRKCPGGVQTYFFNVEGNEDVFLALNEAVASHNDGVAGDRYDHLPAFKQKGEVMTRQDSVMSDYSALSRQSSQNQSSTSTYDKPSRPTSSMGSAQPTYSTLDRDSLPVNEGYESAKAASPYSYQPQSQQANAYDRAARSPSAGDMQQQQGYASLHRQPGGAPEKAYETASHGDLYSSPPAGYQMAQRGGGYEMAQRGGGYDTAQHVGGYDTAQHVGGYESAAAPGYAPAGRTSVYGSSPAGYEAPSRPTSSYDSFAPRTSGSAYDVLGV